MPAEYDMNKSSTSSSSSSTAMTHAPTIATPTLDPADYAFATNSPSQISQVPTAYYYDKIRSGASAAAATSWGVRWDADSKAALLVLLATNPCRDRLALSRAYRRRVLETLRLVQGELFDAVFHGKAMQLVKYLWSVARKGAMVACARAAWGEPCVWDDDMIRRVLLARGDRGCVEMARAWMARGRGEATTTTNKTGPTIIPFLPPPPLPPYPSPLPSSLSLSAAPTSTPTPRPGSTAGSTSAPGHHHHKGDDRYQDENDKGKRNQCRDGGSDTYGDGDGDEDTAVDAGVYSSRRRSRSPSSSSSSCSSYSSFSSSSSSLAASSSSSEGERWGRERGRSRRRRRRRRGGRGGGHDITTDRSCAAAAGPEKVQIQVEEEEEAAAAAADAVSSNAGNSGDAPPQIGLPTRRQPRGLAASRHAS
ncbi:hypothetical protein F5X98DRAFT_381913 [Xylaria grammica]|nr:hypothetical protein F5X98DRAFT_381913 [Xylaria grammica]